MIAELPGVRLGYDDTGAAGDARDVVLFVHGFPHGRRLWAPQLAALGARWRCVAPDLRGFGASDAHGPHTVDRYADDLAGLLDALDVRRAAIVGLSLGGYVALALWRRHPGRVRALVLTDTRSEADDDAVRARRAEHVAIVRAGGLAALADAQLPGAVGATTRARRPAAMAELRALMASCGAVDGSVDGIVGVIGALRDRPDATPTLPTITVPTLLVVGAEDVLTRPSEMRAMAQRIAGARLAVIPEAGHVSSWERPAAFDAALEAFLASLSPAD